QAAALAEAFRERAEQLPANVAEPAAIDDVTKALVRLAAGHAFQAAAEAEVFIDAHLGVKRVAFGQVANALAGLDRVPEDVLAVDGGFARRRGQVAGEDVHGRRLPGPVGAEEADDLGLVDVKADVPDGGIVAVILGEVLDVDHDVDRRGGASKTQSPAQQLLNARARRPRVRGYGLGRFGGPGKPCR